MSAVYMLNNVGERTPPCGTPVLNVVRMCYFHMLCRIASLDVVCD